MTDKACRECHMVSNGEGPCPSCKSSDLSKDWLGYIVVMDAKRSAIAQKMGIKAPGRYALKVR
jgi:DNA-directed RNA polymerase subunit E"